MYVGEIVNFTCHIDISSGWTYKWYKKDKELGTTSSTISFPLGLSDGGDYLCKAFRGGLTTESSDKIHQDVIGKLILLFLNISIIQQCDELLLLCFFIYIIDQFLNIFAIFQMFLCRL